VESVNGEEGPDQPEQTDGAGDYCRHVEAYLCRKNDGHLIRIAGPSFTRVCAWATKGIPLTVVYRGIDRYFERYYSHGPRRRPVQIDFCENDVLDVFDEWRRAVGVWKGGAEAEGAGADTEDLHRRRVTLPAHLQRVIVRLTTLRAGGRLTPGADSVVAAAIRELDAARAGSAHLRGKARDTLVARLRALDADLLDALRQAIGLQGWQAIEREAQDELAPFKPGMAEEAYRRAVEASAARLLRDRTGLPVVEYEE
jgi:hypothetical protein